MVSPSYDGEPYQSSVIAALQASDARPYKVAASLRISVWARRPKPARPARAERPPLSPSSPYAAEPLGSWSPDFSVRVVTQARGGAGRKQNAAAAWALAGAPAATQCLKGFISLAEGQSPQRHRARREAQCRPLPAGKVHKAFSFSPFFLFHARKRKMGCGRLTAANGPRGGTPHTNAIPDRVVLPLSDANAKKPMQHTPHRLFSSY